MTVSSAPLVASSSDPGLVAWRTFLQAHAAVLRRLEAELEAETNLSLSDFDVLVQLALAEGGTLRMSELAERVVISRSGMTRRIDRLEAGGFVERQACASDLRGAMAHLTEAGLARLVAVRPIHMRGVGEYFLDKLESDDLDCLQRVLSKVLPGER